MLYTFVSMEPSDIKLTFAQECLVPNSIFVSYLCLNSMDGERDGLMHGASSHSIEKNCLYSVREPNCNI